MSKHREVGGKNDVQPSFLNQLGGVWIPDKTLFQVFDMASQTTHISWKNSKQKFAISDFLC